MAWSYVVLEGAFSRTNAVVDFSVAYIKYARTASGVSARVVRYRAGRIEVLKHFGTAHNDLSLVSLVEGV